MNLSQIKILNEILQSQSPILNQNHDVYIDNLKQPFIILSTNYILPSVPHSELSFTAAKKYLEAIVPHFSPYLSEFNVLPEARPKRDIGKLMLVKEFQVDNNLFLYIIKFETTYLGGAEKEDKIIEGTQAHSPSVKTSRVYFSSRILPVTEIIKHNGMIVDFVVPSYTPTIYYTEATFDKKKLFSELFDEIDYSPVIDTIKTRLELSAHWKLGKIYEPMFIEYLSMCIRFLSFNILTNIQEFLKFYKIIANVIRKEEYIDLESIQFFHKWLERFSFERSRTISGNMAWKIFYE